jgi:nitrogen fixation protein NifU and related proteins
LLDRQAYIEFLLDHYQSPRNRGRLEDADVVVSGGNPGCGDVVTLYIKRGDGEQLEVVNFEGEGCTISQAGASIIAEMATGAPIEQFENMGFEEIVDLMGKDVVMSRVRCATVGLGTLKAGLKELRIKDLRAEQEAEAGAAPARSHSEDEPAS